MIDLPLRLVLDPVGDELAAALACEADVFLETYGNTEAQFAEEYGPYAASTGFMTLLDQDGWARATTRFIAPGPAGLKTLHDTRRPPWNVDGWRSARAVGIDPARTWDIATIAVRRGTPGGGLAAAALYHGIAAAASANGIDSLVMILDARARRLMSASGIATHTLPGTSEGEYLGSPRSTPVWFHVEAVFDQQRREAPEAYRLIHHGIGLDGISLPTDWTWRRGTRSVSDPAYA